MYYEFFHEDKPYVGTRTRHLVYGEDIIAVESEDFAKWGVQSKEQTACLHNLGINTSPFCAIRPDSCRKNNVMFVDTYEAGDNARAMRNFRSFLYQNE